MLEKLLQEIIVVVVGKQAEPIVPLLNTNKHVNEFTLAKKLGITINQTRNILYKISDYGLVSSLRKKDKKKGWYTYYWKFEILKCLEFLKNLLLEKKQEMDKESIERGSKTYYACELCNLEYGEDQALLMDFTCDECGELFTTKDNSKLVKDLDKNSAKIDEKLALVEIELEKERVKLEKVKQIGLKKEEKELELKKEVMKQKRLDKKKERDKLKGKVEKKKAPTKKKIVAKKISTKKKVVAKKTPVKKKTVKSLVKKVVKKVTKKKK